MGSPRMARTLSRSVTSLGLPPFRSTQFVKSRILTVCSTGILVTVTRTVANPTKGREVIGSHCQRSLIVNPAYFAIKRMNPLLVRRTMGDHFVWFPRSKLPEKPGFRVAVYNRFVPAAFPNFDNHVAI